MNTNTDRLAEYDVAMILYLVKSLKNLQKIIVSEETSDELVDDIGDIVIFYWV